ncbi:MAG: DUF21 domain-containing protein [Actinomycetales bacterium]|nr:DUF21 domain-containing protein [Actinomycetales bacterium]
MSPFVALSITVVLLALNALFVAAEFALLSTRRTQLEPLAQAGSNSAKLALKAIENVTLAMAAAQLGITICSLGLGAISEPAIAHFLEPAFHAMSVPDALVHPIAFTIALTFVCSCTLFMARWFRRISRWPHRTKRPSSSARSCWVSCFCSSRWWSR